ncbi:MAG: M6 family metalloprotease domain-containing protein [Gemmatimonadota bacterium]|nr:M6 family metalloprotease domain-containing protein [Gemmatimonadota bacterium]
MLKTTDKIFLPLLLLTLCLQNPLAGVAPPARGIQAPPGFAQFVAGKNDQCRSSLLPRRNAAAAGALLAGSAPARITLPVILAGYADRQGTVEPADFKSRLFGQFPSGSMSDYYAEVSSGLFSLEGDVFGWVRAPLTQDRYTAGGPLGNDSSYPDNPEGFVSHAVRAADSLVDYSLYDNDGPDGLPNSGDDDGVVDAILVVHPGGDAATGDAANLWSHTGNLGPLTVETEDPAAGGGRIKIDLYSLVPELSGDGTSPLAAGIGVFCHEFGHQLGLVDLYNTAGESLSAAAGQPSGGIGYWGLMGHGSYGGDGASPQKPVHPCAWSKLRLGWVTTVVEDRTGELSLDPVDQAGRLARLWDNNNRDLSYFLLSCRRRQGFDSQLPGEGLLVWHVDERMLDNNDPARQLVDLEEADGRSDLDLSANLGDEGDPFPGSAQNTGFATLTDPSSALYDGSASGVAVTGIRIEGGRAYFTVSQPRRTGLTLAWDEFTADPAGFGYGDNLAYGAVVFSAPQAGVLEAVSTYFLYPGMSCHLELYTGEDGGVMRCRIHEQAGQAENVGWRTLSLEQPVWLDASDTVVVAVGYTSAGFDEGRPVPYDPTGRHEGRSLVDYEGLGAFTEFDRDLAIRAVLNTDYQKDDYIRIGPILALESSRIDLGRCFSSERYRFDLRLVNLGARNAAISDIALEGAGFLLGEYEHVVPCGVVLDIPLEFSVLETGTYSGTVTIATGGEYPGQLEAVLLSEVAGYSLRYDSTSVPEGYWSITETAHGAARFTMPEQGLLGGVRVYLLQRFMNLRLSLWAESSMPYGFKCLVAEAATDSLIAGPGWHQLMFDLPVDIDSGDTFIADVRFSAPGQSYSPLVPVDTFRTTEAGCYYNRREGGTWLTSQCPLGIRALVLGTDQAIETGRILKRPEAQARGPVILEGLKTGEPATGGIWLVNRGTARYRASLYPALDNSGLVIDGAQAVVPCRDSVFVHFTYTPDALGLDTVLVHIETTDDEAPLIEVQVLASVEYFDLAYDEQGATATAGFAAPTAWAAVVFETPWPGLMESVQVYLTGRGMRINAAVYPGAGPVSAENLTGALAALEDSLPLGGWQSLILDTPLYFDAGESFIVVAAVTEPQGGKGLPLSLDTRGEPSGRSWAAAQLEGPWEKLTCDLNLRAGFRTPGSAALVPGDVDHSGATDIFDLIRLIQVLSGQTGAQGASDVDRSGATDIFDLIALLVMLSV